MEKTINYLYSAITPNPDDMAIISKGFGILCIIILILIIRKLLGKIAVGYYKQAAAVVKDTSPRLKRQEELNKELPFHIIEPEVTIKVETRTKKACERYSFDALLVDTLRRQLKQYDTIVRHIIENQEILIKRETEMPALYRQTTMEQKKQIAPRIPFLLYRSIEDRIFNDRDKKPTIDFCINLVASYTSPSKRVHYEQKKSYEFDQIRQYLAVVKQGVASAAYQRSLMTPGLRYDILKRDNFTCQICGRTARDGAQLQVDHIKAVSKGGLTEKSNLRCLCELCNIGKSNKFDPNGLN